ncbi:MAG: tRNA pseudouridine(38-40) synthase TruA [Betaproteobacteria bacterium]|uniref:tRNA pseudouridine synthase A n=1 Tax=Candidatus Proximibacter danicus TaxID=2954365 RepID=A0A9D7PTQ3_9PROT|nr:tRNA pseudouridine(38-40) synthase TruA [Candidatus Proximibacter danicus]
MRIALCIEYDGSGFRGWQTQSGGGTVQDALQAALSQIAGEPIQVACAGRTDAGVHATAQIVHFDSCAERPLSAWVRGTNALLPPTVAVRWAQGVADDFHARFSASGRRYRYLLLNRQQRPALAQAQVGWFHLPLDLAAMQAGAQFLLGEQDFSCFRAAECQAKSPVKVLRQASIGREAETLVFDFEASAFLHHMVRNMVGSLVYVGNGKHPPEWIGELIASRERRLAAPTFAADGLYLSGVSYEQHWGLPPLPGPVLPGFKP